LTPIVYQSFKTNLTQSRQDAKGNGGQQRYSADKRFEP